MPACPAHRKPASADFPPYPGPALHPVRRFHTEQAGRHACALQHRYSKSLSQSVSQLWSLSFVPSYPILSCPVPAWHWLPRPPQRTIRWILLDIQHLRGWTNAYCSAHYCFIIHIHFQVPLGLAYKCGVSFSPSCGLWQQFCNFLSLCAKSLRIFLGESVPNRSVLFSEVIALLPIVLSENM